jgi:hypothetical protein
MRPSPSLHHVVVLLDHRRRRYHRVRRLWGLGLGLLGGGLLLLGGWVTLPVSLQALFPAVALPPVVVPAQPAEVPGGHGSPGVPLGKSPLLLVGVRQPHACQTLPPWQAACTPDESFDATFSTLLWHATAPSRTLGTRSSSTLPGLPARVAPSPPRLAAPTCGTPPCPAAPVVRRPLPVLTRLPEGRKSQALRPASPRKPAKPVPFQPSVSAYGSPVLAEPERLMVNPVEPERLVVNP